MSLEEINQFIEEERKRLEKYYGDKEDSELTMATGFKLVEEMGELFNELLTYKGYQRKDKLENFDMKNLEKEFADVIFVTLILAKRFNIDVEKAIKIKMAEVKGRVYKK